MLRFALLFALALPSSVIAAAILLPGASVTTAGSPNSGGTVFADITGSFVAQSGLFSGTLRTVVVRSSAGTFDFYYQLRNTTSDPTEFIDGFTASDFSGFSTEVDWSTNGIAGIAGATAFQVGLVPSMSAERDLTPADDVTFFYPFAVFDNSALENPSAFLFIRTDARGYGPGTVVVSGAGTTLPISSFAPAPVPEPGNAVMALGLLTVGAVSKWGRKRRHNS